MVWPAGTDPSPGDAVSQPTPRIVPWLLSGNQSVGPNEVPITPVTSMLPSSFPR